MKKWGVLIILIIVGGIIGYNYLYQDHRDIESELSEFTITTESFFEEFQINSEDSELKYLDKTITVTGEITKIEDQSLAIDNIVFCQFQEKINHQIEVATNIKIKGRFLGYDDLLQEIKLDQCHIIEIY